MITRLDAMWMAVGRVGDDAAAIAEVEAERHLGLGRDESRPCGVCGIALGESHTGCAAVSGVGA